MRNWLPVWLTGYKTTFISPHSSVVCQQILRDQSQRDYFEKDAVRRFARQKKRGLFIVVDETDNGSYAFTMERTLPIEINNKPLRMTLKGTLTPTDVGTEIAIKMDNRGLLFPMLFVSFIWFAILGGFLTLLTRLPLQTMLAVLWSILFIWITETTMRRFCTSPQKWLTDAPQPRIKQALRPFPQPFQRKFNFFSPEPLPMCVARLTQNNYHEHFQMTPFGMLHGKTVQPRYFIAFQEESPSEIYFYMARDNVFNNDKIPVQLIGRLRDEETGTRIEGYASNPYGWWMSLLVIPILIIPTVFLRGVGLFIGGVSGAVYLGILTMFTSDLANYPIRQIIGGEKFVRSSWQFWNWLRFRHRFDFHSPYPVEDCVNMLLSYSPTKDYQTQWGLGRGVKLDDDTLIKIFQQDENTYHIEITPRGRSSVMKPNIQAIGTLQTEGYGTRVIGSASNRMTYAVLPILMMIIGSAIPALFWRGLLLIIVPFSLLVFGAVWVDILRTTYLVSTYPQRLLESAGERKDKKDLEDV